MLNVVIRNKHNDCIITKYPTSFDDEYKTLFYVIFIVKLQDDEYFTIEDIEEE